MSRIRSIKPEFFRSRSLAKCSLPAMLTFAGLWTEADDLGNGIADVDLLKGAIWPKRREITAEDIDGHLVELADTSHIALYEVEGERYYHVLKWVRHQPASTRRTETGKFPTPGEASLPVVKEPDANVQVTPEIVKNHDESCSDPTPSEQIPPYQVSSVKGQVSRVNGAENGAENLARRTVRAPDPLFDAFVGESGARPETESERGAWNGALKQLRTAGASADDVHARCAEHRRRWPNATLSLPSLAKHWGALGVRDGSGGQQPQSAGVLDRAAQRMVR